MEAFYRQITEEFTHAFELYGDSKRLLEQCEPSFARVCQSILAPPPGFAENLAPNILSVEPRRIIELMCWWAKFGDFESVLPELLPGAKRQGILTSRERPVAKAEVAKLRAQRFGENTSHPLNWYVSCKANEEIKRFLSCDCVGEALTVQIAGG